MRLLIHIYRILSLLSSLFVSWIVNRSQQKSPATETLPEEGLKLSIFCLHNPTDLRYESCLGLNLPVNDQASPYSNSTTEICTMMSLSTKRLRDFLTIPLLLATIVGLASEFPICTAQFFPSGRCL